jgi:hypothetical protein
MSFRVEDLVLRPTTKLPTTSMIAFLRVHLPREVLGIPWRTSSTTCLGVPSFHVLGFALCTAVHCNARMYPTPMNFAAFNGS